ncbi:acetyl/propionyl/methylcrotonyl-CoA carboxylase subunit alpha [Alicycliphilus sp. T452]
MFSKVLIANRGEIACRIARTLRRMGVAVATVHSTADANALHVQEIGESVWIGDGPARQSYLDIDAVLKAAQAVGADAIHPGFGFLSENPLLARRCAEFGITFIGPTPETLELFGDKSAAKLAAQRLGIPTAGGLTNATEEVERVMSAISDLPLPCVVKAVAGGGGKGMRVIRSIEAARGAVEAAIREGRSSFGDGRVIVERYLNKPRHVEVQILGDGAGNVVHLYDRECSLQRRHQKVIEEAPVCSISDELRRQLWAHSVALGEAARYLGLGTVEFAVTQDAAVFLEVNPRLQVEHPVTESVLGFDLVELQVRTIADRRLAVEQAQVPAPCGHAVQARLYAEDAAQGFLPSTGRIESFSVGLGVRADNGVIAGCEISPHYDPMIAKLIAHDSTRERALKRLREALQQTTVLGVTSNRAFLISLLGMPQVAANTVDTETIDEWLAAHAKSRESAGHVAALMAVWRHAVHRASAASGAWGDAAFTGWRMRRDPAGKAGTLSITPRYDVSTPSGRWQVGFGATRPDGLWPVRIDDDLFDVGVGQPLADGSWLVTLGRRTMRMSARCQAGRAWADLEDAQLALDIKPLHAAQGGGGADHSGVAVAPMMGLMVAIHVEAGQRVAAGDRLATLESMKMEMPVVAAIDGVVRWVGCSVGGKVERNQELFRIADEA